jgi:hypothetical protein
MPACAGMTAVPSIQILAIATIAIFAAHHMMNII